MFGPKRFKTIVTKRHDWYEMTLDYNCWILHHSYEMKMNYPAVASSFVSKLTFNYCPSNNSSIYVSSKWHWTTFDHFRYIYVRNETELLPPDAAQMSKMTIIFANWLVPSKSQMKSNYRKTQCDRAHCSASRTDLRQVAKLSRQSTPR